MSPAGAGIRPAGMRAICPSEVPVKLGETWLDKMALDKVLGTPKEMTVEEIDQAVAEWVRGAVVAKEAGFAGCQLHGRLRSERRSERKRRLTKKNRGTRLSALAVLVTSHESPNGRLRRLTAEEDEAAATTSNRDSRTRRTKSNPECQVEFRRLHGVRWIGTR